MTIVLFILKIIGVVLLTLIGISLLAILAVLFVPFRYRVRVDSGGEEKQDNDQSISAVVRVHWLLHFLGAEVSFLDGQLDIFLRILFWRKKLLNNEEAKEDEAEFEQEAKAAAKDVAEEAVMSPEEIVKPSKGTVTLSQDAKSDTQGDTLEVMQQKAPKGTVSEEKQKNLIKEDSKKNSSINKEENNKESNKKASNKEESSKEESGKKEKDKEENNKEEQSDSIITRMKKLWNNFSNFRKKITRMVEDERNHRAVSHLKSELICILQAIRPRKLSIDMEFSLGSPDLTGEVLGVCALFPIFYQNGNRLIPDFESDETYAKGHVNAKGRIYLFQILFAVLRILFDKDCKRMYRMYKKYFG